MKKLCLLFFVTTGLFSQEFKTNHSETDFQRSSIELSKSIPLQITQASEASASGNKMNKGLDTTIDVQSVPTNGPNQFHIDFVGTANLQQNISEADEEVQGSAGLGVIFERYFLERDENGYVATKYRSKFIESLDMEAYINVASSVDSLRTELDEEGSISNQRAFGTYILNPVSPKQSIFINANVFFNPWMEGWFTKWISGANFRVNASNVLWNLNDGTDNISRYAGAINVRFGVFHEFLPNNKIRDDKNKRKYSVRLGLNYSARHITGDISSGSNDPLRERFLGTTDKDFSGWEPTFGFRLNNIIAEFAMPMIGGSSKSDIEGLTDTQFLFSIRFVGGFSLKVDGKEDKNKKGEEDKETENQGSG